MATEIDWNVIELTEIYESFDMVLRLLDEDFERARRLLDEDFERARRVIDAAIKHGATPESMTEPIEDFAIELHAYCEAIERSKGQKPNKDQNT